MADNYPAASSGEEQGHANRLRLARQADNHRKEDDEDGGADSKDVKKPSTASVAMETGKTVGNPVAQAKLAREVKFSDTAYFIAMALAVLKDILDVALVETVIVPMILGICFSVVIFMLFFIGDTFGGSGGSRKSFRYMLLSSGFIFEMLPVASIVPVGVVVDLIVYYMVLVERRMIRKRESEEK